jgi:hypothetical protein
VPASTTSNNTTYRNDATNRSNRSNRSNRTNRTNRNNRNNRNSRNNRNNNGQGDSDQCRVVLGRVYVFGVVPIVSSCDGGGWQRSNHVEKPHGQHR